MKKNITMKKNTLVNGTLITIIGIVISKILGIIYVVPFHEVIGEQGGALYGYAYTIYTLFMSLASAGIPLAISKIVSEYQTLGYYKAKKKVFSLAKKISLGLGFLSFIIIVLTAPMLAKAILGNTTGGNTIKDVTFVIRVISTAILIVPLLSVYRGYFIGHRFMSPPSISQVIEQIVRVLIIIFGSFMALKVFKLSLASSVGIALLGATIGAIFSLIYLYTKKVKNNTKFNEKIRNVNEPIINNKTIIKKIFYYALPFILIDIFKSLYNYIDMITVVRGLTNNVGYSVNDAETIYSMLSTWAWKFNMIVLSISSGVVVSLIPSLTESLVKNKQQDLNNKICQSLEMFLFLAVPMTFGISFLSKSIWILFYGNSVYGPSVLSYYIFLGLFIGLFTVSVTILQTLKDYKSVVLSLILGIILKIILNNKLMLVFNYFGLPPYYGYITASLLGYVFSLIFCLVVLNKKYNIKFEKFLKVLMDIVCGSILMLLILFLLKIFVPIYSYARLSNILIIIVYGVFGIIIYFIYSYYSKLVDNVFGGNFWKKLSKILIKK